MQFIDFLEVSSILGVVLNEREIDDSHELLEKCHSNNATLTLKDVMKSEEGFKACAENAVDQDGLLFDIILASQTRNYTHVFRKYAINYSAEAHKRQFIFADTVRFVPRSSSVTATTIRRSARASRWKKPKGKC